MAKKPTEVDNRFPYQRRETLVDFWATEEGGDPNLVAFNVGKLPSRPPRRSAQSPMSLPMAWVKHKMEPFAQKDHTKAFPPPTATEAVRQQHQPTNQQANSTTAFELEQRRLRAEDGRAEGHSHTSLKDIFQRDSALALPTSRREESEWIQRISQYTKLYSATQPNVPYAPSMGQLARNAAEMQRQARPPAEASAESVEDDHGLNDAERRTLRTDPSLTAERQRNHENLTYEFVPPSHAKEYLRKNELPAALFESTLAVSRQADNQGTSARQEVDDTQSKTDERGLMAWLRKGLLPAARYHRELVGGSDDDADGYDSDEFAEKMLLHKNQQRQSHASADGTAVSRHDSARYGPLPIGHDSPVGLRVDHIRFSAKRPQPSAPPPPDFSIVPSYSNISTSDRSLPPGHGHSVFVEMSAEKGKPSAALNLLNDTKDGRIDASAMQGWMRDRLHEGINWRAMAQPDASPHVIQGDVPLWHCRTAHHHTDIGL